MARSKGSIGWKKQQAYLHEKFPDQGWMDETDKKVINEHYKEVKEKGHFLLDELTEQAQELKMGY